MIVFQVSLSFDSVKEILKLRFQIYILVKQDYSVENASDNEIFCSAIPQLFQFEPEH